MRMAQSVKFVFMSPALTSKATLGAVQSVMPAAGVETGRSLEPTGQAD